jgi:hypothetical protein
MLDSAPAGEERARAVDWVAHAWGEGDPTAAFAWAEGQEDPAATTAAARGWAKHDPFAMSEHLLEMSPGAGRDGATAALVEAIHGSDPDAGLRWATRIGDPPQRVAAMQEVLRGWVLSRGPEAAQEALGESDLPAAEQEQMREFIEGGVR